jgi:glycosyltransferase involved in cell wall biosynthesis
LSVAAEFEDFWFFVTGRTSQTCLPKAIFLRTIKLTAPLVSVCIATFNQDRYIKDCIVSVLMQAPDVELEILVGDDGTGTQTADIVARLARLHPGKIRYFKHEKNLGPSANYQFLIREARGLFVAHLDGDDFWLPGKLAPQLAWLNENPASLACYTNAVVINDAQEVQGVFSSVIRQPVDLAFLLAKGNFLTHSSMLYRASAKNALLEFEGPFIDYRMHLTFARHAKLGLLDAALVVYRLGSEHSMVRTTPKLVHNLYFDALRSILSDALVSNTLRRQALRHFWKAIAVEALVKRRFGWGLEWARKIGASYPHDFLAIAVWGIALAPVTLTGLLARRLARRMFKLDSLRVLHER